MARDYSFRPAPSSRSSAPRQATSVVVPSRATPRPMASHSVGVIQQDIMPPVQKAITHSTTPLQAPIKTVSTQGAPAATTYTGYAGSTMEFIKPRVRLSEASKPQVSGNVVPVIHVPHQATAPVSGAMQDRSKETTGQATAMKAKHRNQARQSLFHFPKFRTASAIGYGLAVLAIVIGSAISFQTIQSNAENKKQVTQLKQDATAITNAQASGQKSVGVSSPTKAAVAYSVAPDLPKYISIARLGIHNVKIIQVGLTKEGAVGAPLDALTTAWYDGSAKPGDATGAMFVDGHVEGDNNGGAVLTKLQTLVTGDTITITRGDDKTFTFEVVKKALVAVDAVDMGQMIKSVDSTKLGLNLMTCGGTYDKKTQTFDHRTEVFAVLRK